jgi:hypothetical protein
VLASYFRPQSPNLGSSTMHDGLNCLNADHFREVKVVGKNFQLVLHQHRSGRLIATAKNYH